MSNGDISDIDIIYDISLGIDEFDEKEGKYNINIFGYEFVKNNNNICKLIIDNNEYKITPKYNIRKYKKDILKIKLKGIDKITNMSYMFYNCSLLRSLSDISKWNTNNVKDMFNMFNKCSSLSSLPDISKLNTSNVLNVSSIFNGCSLLSSLPDIKMEY